MRELTSLVLASASPRRFELLASLGLHVSVMPSHVVEDARPGLSPRDLAIALAAEKVAVVAEREPTRFVVGADTLVDVDGEALGKPADARAAAAMLRRLSGREHLVHTAYAVRDRAAGIAFDAASTTRVCFVTLEDAAIDAYVASEDPLDKAGAYGIQGRGAALVESIAGDYHTVMGFPLGDFLRRSAALGYRVGGVAAPAAYA